MKEQRHLPALRAHIDKMLGNGWKIISRSPLKLRNGRRTCLVMHGMLIGETVHPDSPVPATARASAS